MSDKKLETVQEPKKESKPPRVVVCVGFGGWYPRGVDRLVKSLKDVGWDGEVMAWKQPPEGCAAPSKYPYEFKIRAMEIARDRGFGATLWADSSVYFVRNPDPVFDRIERDRYYLFSEGWSVGQWCSDAALDIMELDREESFNITSLSAITYGLDLSTDLARNLLHEERILSDKGAFFGDWKNDRQQVSKDPRVLGHRHDQTCLSVLVHRRKMYVEVPPLKRFMRKPWPNDELPDGIVATAQGL